jgi:hypothetical protein
MASSFTQNVIWDNQEIATIYLPVEELTGIFTRQLIEKSGITSPEYDRDKNPLVVYDNACGIGIFSAQLMELLSPTARIQLSLTCGDTAAPIVNSVRERILDLGSRKATQRRGSSTHKQVACPARTIRTYIQPSG